MSDHTVDKRSLRGLLVAQFFGAFNDSCFKLCLIFAALEKDSPLLGRLPGAQSFVGPDDEWNAQVRLVIAATVLFTVPFLIFSPHAGRIADRFSKRSVTVGVKAAEIFLMVLGAVGFFLASPWLLMGVLFLMAVQSTVFSPAKYGILPELLPASELPRANGLLEMTTFLAIILGTVASGPLYDFSFGQKFVIGIALTLLATIGFVASLAIRPLEPAVPDRKIDLNPLPELKSCLRALLPNRTLRFTALGITYFWALGVVVQLAIAFYGYQELGLSKSETSFLQGAIACGIGVGSILAGYLSHEKPELGLVPLGSFGMGFAVFFLFWPQFGFWWAFVWLAVAGVCGGFFIVPLNVLLQQEAPRDQKGRLIAGVNLFTNGGMLVALGVLWLLLNPLAFEPASVFFVLGLATIIATFFVFSIIPDAFFRFFFWVITNVVYKIKVVGRENLPTTGPALLVPNHVSYVDANLILASTHRQIRFVAYRGFCESPVVRWISKVLRVIPISPDDGPREIVGSLKEASNALAADELVCIFPEGQISRTGHLLPFRSGVEKILKGGTAPVIPVYLDRVWGSIFSFEAGKVFWKLPRRLPYPVTIRIGEPLPPSTSLEEIRQGVQELGSEAFLERKKDQEPIAWLCARECRRQPFRLAAVDSTGARTTRMQFLTRAIALARALSHRFRDEPMIGILIPPSVASAVANVAASLLGKPVVNFNFTAGPDALRSAAEQCGITRVLTSKKFLDSVAVEVPGEVVLIDELGAETGVVDRALAALVAWCFPLPLVRRFIGGRKATMDDIVTVIFSSGSTGEPKGVELTNFNILSNVQGMAQVSDFRRQDRLLGVLPFFHSTGYTTALWIPLLNRMAAIYHPNPLEGRVVGRMAKTHGATILIATPTFLQTYTRRCDPGDFGSLRYVVVGAEALKPAVRDAFLEKFGIEPLEGYGTTECAPIVALNVPDFRGRGLRQVGQKRGVGHPLPGVSVRIVDPDTFETKPRGEDGLLLVAGPNVMRGYLGKPELTAEVLRDGWYVTGDIATVDEDGFLTLTDRLARFAKISGEMVPNMKVEEALQELVDTCEQCLVVTSVPDEKKGERLAVVHVLEDGALELLLDKLPELSRSLPNLWIPRKDVFVKVDKIPVLGTGKVDLRSVREIAQRELAT